MPAHAVPVHAHTIRAAEVAADLREHGMVVIETMRTTAARLSEQVQALLGVDPLDEHGPRLIHLSEAVFLDDPADGFGWVDYLMYGDAIDGLYEVRSHLLGDAIRQWRRAGSPDRYLAKIVIA